MVTHPVLTGVGVAQPETPLGQAAAWDGFFSGHFGHSRAARRIFLNAGVQTRYPAVHPLVEDISGCGTGQRMRRYADAAPPLGRAAVTRALAAAGLDPSEVGMFAVVSCTGYSTPGLDITLAADLGMPADVQRLCIGHMGCYAALPGIGAVGDYVAGRGRPAVLLCVELPSLHLQPPTRDIEQVVAHALFSDAAAAAVVTPGGGSGLALLDLVAFTARDTADQMTWRVTDHGFRMRLSPRVADGLGVHVADVVGKLLARHGLTPADVASWAVHPGGPRILDVVGDRLGLPADALRASRTTLRDHGNCSSGTVLMVLDEAARQRPFGPGDHVVAMAFGPGLTLYAGLLRAV